MCNGSRNKKSVLSNQSTIQPQQLNHITVLCQVCDIKLQVTVFFGHNSQNHQSLYVTLIALFEKKNFIKMLSL